MHELGSGVGCYLTRHGAAALAAVQTEDSRFQDCGSGVQCECLFSFLSLWKSRFESFHILDNLVQRLICQKSIYRNKSAVITHCEVQITIENSLSNSEVVLEVRFSPIHHIYTQCTNFCMLWTFNLAAFHLCQ